MRRKLRKRGCGCLVTLLLLAVALVYIITHSTGIEQRLFPTDYQDYVEEACGFHGFDDTWLIMAMIREESNFKADAESSAGACGLMQLMPDTAQWVIDTADMEFSLDDALWHPRCNIWVGVWYIQWLRETYYQSRSTACAIAAYNAGHSTVDGWLAEGLWDGSVENISGIPYAETRQYIQYVYKSRDIYQRLYGNND